MKKGEQQILRFLLTKTGWVTANLIAANIGCSIRSVKSRISDINAANSNLIISSRSGYQIGNRPLAQQLANNRASTPQDTDERHIWLIRKLLIENQHVSLETLANSLFISYQTLEKLLNSLKPRLATYGLSLKTKNGVVHISGSENNKRNMLIDLIYDEMTDSYSGSSVIQSFLPNVNTGVIREIINSTLSKHNYYIDDYSLVNLSMLLAVTIERELASPSAATNEETRPSPTAHLSEIVEEIAKQIDAYFNVTLTGADLSDITLLLSTRASNKETVVAASYPQLDTLLEKIRERLKLVFGFELTESDHMVRFRVHLHNMLIRLQNNVKLKNPDWVNFKRTYPYIFEIAVVVAEMVARELGCTVSEDEIGYLAIHIYVLLEEQKSLEQKIRAMLISPKYSDLHTSLARRLSGIFSEDLLIVDVVSAYDDIPEGTRFDFIISSISLPSRCTESVVTISSQPTSRELILIEEEIVRQRLLHMQHVFGEELSTLFADNFYFYNLPLKSREEIIDYLCGELKREGYIDESFIKSVYARENVCSSAMGNIALPHPLKANSKKSAIAVAVQPNGVIWGSSTNVNLILLLSICPDDMPLFQDIYAFVSEFISDSANLQLIMRAKNSAEFITLVESFFFTKLNN